MPSPLIDAANEMSDSGIIEQISLAISGGGLLEFSPFRILFEELVEEKMGDAATFSEFYQITRKRLVIVGTNLTDQCAVYFSHETYPDMSVMDAVEISCSIPFIFRSREILFDGDDVIEYTDGGLVDNFPIDVVNDGRPHLAIYIDSTNTSELSLLSKTKRCISLPLRVNSLNSMFYSTNNVDIVQIVCGSEITSPFNFSPTKREKMMMFRHGLQAAKEESRWVKLMVNGW